MTAVAVHEDVRAIGTDAKWCMREGCGRLMARRTRRRICDVCIAHDEALKCCRDCGGKRTGLLFCASCAERRLVERDRTGARAPKPCERCGGAKEVGHGCCRYCLACKAAREEEHHRRTHCHHCGAEKSPGHGRKLCDACHAETVALQPCHVCGERKEKVHGSRVCLDCEEVAKWRTQQRRRARRGLGRKPCRRCLRPKGPGVCRIYCDACIAARAREEKAPRTCNKCHDRPVTTPLAKYCEPCREEGRKRRREASTESARRRRARPGYKEPKRRPKSKTHRSDPRLPSRPLADAITRLIERERRDNPVMSDMGSGGGGVNSNQMIVIERLFREYEAGVRAYTGWRAGERMTVSVAEADYVLMCAGWEWWDVWNEESVRRWRLRAQRVTHRPRTASKKAYRHVHETQFVGDLGPDLVELGRIADVFAGKRGVAAWPVAMAA